MIIKYIIENGIVTNRVIGEIPTTDGITVIEREDTFGDIGDWYDEINDVCKKIVDGYKRLDITTGDYEWDESRIDEAKTESSQNIKSICDEKDNSDFEYPIGSGLFYEATNAIINTLQRGATLSDTEPIPCNNGMWDTSDGLTSTSFTMGDLKQLYNHGYDIPENNYRNMKTHLLNINSLTSIQEVVEYDYSTGWKY